MGCIKSTVYGQLIWRLDDNSNLILSPQSDPSQIFARAEQVSNLDISGTPLKSTLILTVYSITPSAELELQILSSFTYLEHKKRLNRKITKLDTAIGLLNTVLRGLEI
ncbi:hypothetical protein BT96DRAFT_917135 [Gymnopus androsaceus JB14]|uniref:Uncharacterized protein n=1 Tax=Gymnopus androsaceus JB14 TaxID=1447944 RepID=A0A6A4I572_9AGAR|nr:hypothetical protein BT96DRAFT_917135 [Gymnopus androsaceus JB14]